MIEFNKDSTEDISRLLFGGPFYEKGLEPELDENGKVKIYGRGAKKAGEIKYKVKQQLKFVEGLGVIPKIEWKREKEGFYKADESVLETVRKDANSPQIAKDVCNIVLENRTLRKLVTTYYEGYKDYINEDGFIRPHFLHVKTGTGRLASNNPNSQNISNDELVKSHFVSRFENGVLISADYGMLEVVVFAHLCKDPTLMKLIRDGIDIHRYIGSYIYDKPMDEITTEERKAIKPCSFNVIYGGGPGMLMQQSGQTYEFCKQFIETFYQLFPNGKRWHDHILKEVNRTGELRNFTGRILRFKKFPAKYDWQIRKGILESYNPPDIKNWPVQSLATSDIVLIMLGKLWRKLIHHRDKCLLINTIHDSVLIDCKKEYIEEISKIVKETLEEVAPMCYNYWSHEWDLPITVDIKVGETWAQC